jgi:hypothetical protein
MTRISKRTRIGLSASAVACIALSITFSCGNREIGFGEAISDLQQRSALFIAAAMFAVHLLLFIKERREKR